VGKDWHEGVHQIAEEARRRRGLCRLQIHHGPLEAFLGEFGDGLQEEKGDVGAGGGGAALTIAAVEDCLEEGAPSL